jgi:hypothetical protein
MFGKLKATESPNGGSQEHSTGVDTNLCPQNSIYKINLGLKMPEEI